MSGSSGLKMGNDDRKNVLPSKPASGPGYLGPEYNPADELVAPAQIGVRRGDNLSDVLGAIKGVAYYQDMIGFGESSSGFTKGMPGLKPLGVNYFMRTGASCSNGAEMWEYVQTIPDGSALGDKVRNSIREMGLPELRGMAPGILEDAKAALNPYPVINAVVGSGYPQCRLVKMPVGDFDGKISNSDGKLIVDPEGLLRTSGGRFFQEKWIQDRRFPPVRKPGESDMEFFLRGDPIQLPYEDWDKVPKIYGEDGCFRDPPTAPPGASQPVFCTRKNEITEIKLPDNSLIYAVGIDGFRDYRKKGIEEKKVPAIVSLSCATIALMGLLLFWTTQKRS